MDSPARHSSDDDVCIIDYDDDKANLNLPKDIPEPDAGTFIANKANFHDGDSGLFPWTNSILFITDNKPSSEHDYDDDDGDALCNVNVEIKSEDEDVELEENEDEGEVELVPNWIGHQMVDEDDKDDDDCDIGVIYPKPNRNRLDYDSDESFQAPPEDYESTDSEFESDSPTPNQTHKYGPRYPRFIPLIVPTSLPSSTSPYVALKPISVAQLRAHGVKPPKKDKRLSCSQCGVRVADKYKLKRHTLRKHPDKTEADSSQGAAAATSQDQLFIDTRDGKPPVSFMDFRSGLDYGLLDVGGGKMKCPICPKVLGRRQRLDIHIKKIHSTKAVARRQRLQELDDGKSKLKCPLCSSRYSRKDKLNRHVKTVHKTSSS